MSDPRLTPVNDRIVARWLVEAYPDRAPADPEPPCHVATPVLDLSLSPGGPRDRQLRYGEGFEVLERRDGFAFGIAPLAEYVGWVAESGLTPASDRGAALDWIGARQTHVYAAPDFKSPERMALPHMAIVAAGETEGRFTRTELGWVSTAHLADRPETDPVAVAERYLGTPYLWGANSAFGIDCSGLVQVALHACGQPCPGDSDLQEAALGEAVAPEAPVHRGDLFFWSGHVALAVDEHTLIHANVHHMAVALEPIDAAMSRIAAQGDGPVTARRRL
ncbi:NlpC/P60 family protein [Roseovarius sp. SYSU LYC5161]|uniref:C40 family peptidase n=1 Tax=Roseovarius halophilus (ex Wu et al. 2025) TaxID=3376060 RepID=UPI0039996897